MIFLEKARLATNKAIHDETIRLQMEDGPTTFYELLDKIFSTEAISASQSFEAAAFNPIQDVINGAADVFNQFTSGVTTFLNNGKTKPSDPKPPTLIVPDRNKSYSEQPAVPIDGFFESLAFATNGTGQFLSDLTGGIIDAEVLNSGLDLIGKTVDDFLNGRVDLGGAINRIIGFFTQVFGAENPLGKFIQNLATYLSNNQDGILANIIKFATFINAAVVTIAAIIFNTISNIVGGITKSIYNFFSTVVNNLLGGFFHRLQMGENFDDFGSSFMDIYAAQGIDPTSLAQQFINLANAAVKKILAADPFILSAFLNPNQENITKVFNTIVKVLSDKA